MKNLKERIKYNKVKLLIISALLFCSLLVAMDYNVYLQAKGTSILSTQNGLDALEANVISSTQSTNEVGNSVAEKDFIYLSDLEYITTKGWSYNGWSGHNIEIDRPPEGDTIRLIEDGVVRSFSKGIGLHAKGQVIYNIENISTMYSHFIARLGVDASRGSNGSLWFEIFVSNDGSSWTSLQKTDVLKGTSPAVLVDLDVSGYKYLKIYVDPAGENGSDHGVIADAKLASISYSEMDGLYDQIHKVDYYDTLLKAKDAQYNYENNYRLILEREFVRKMGFWNLQDAILKDEKYKNTIDWIFSQDEILEQTIEVGELSNPSLFMQVLSDLYTTYSDCLTTQDGYVYQKMMIGLAAAYSSDTIHSPMAFSAQSASYDYVERFSLMKKLYDEDLFGKQNYEPNIKEQYKTYHVEHMRMLMQESIRNDELLWLNYQSTLKNKDLYNIQYYVRYVSPNYSHPEYYDIANKEKYDTKYGLSLYGVPFATDNKSRYWMAMENGGICWNQSRFASSLNRLNGIPATGFFQPAHEGYFTYSVNEQNQGVWNLMNNLSGWGRSSTKWYGGVRYRLLFDWANKPFADQNENAANHGNSAGYLVLAQANLNDYDHYKESLYYNLLANSYEDTRMKVEVYKKALEVENLNLDSYDYLIQNYKILNKTSEEWHQLAEKIITSYTYYPNAMYDLLKLIKPYLNDVDKLDINLKEHDALLLASKATANETLQYGAAKEIANVLLGKDYEPFATFTFEKNEKGETIGKILVSEVYSQIDIKYSLDGGNTYSAALNTGATPESHTIVLSKEEAEKINENDDIKIDILPLGEPVNIFTIAITKGTLPSNLYANDLENRIVGATLDMEWRLSGEEMWTSYHDASPNLTGDKTIEVRTSYQNTQVASDSAKYTFTADQQLDTRKYIPVSHLSIDSYSTQSVDAKRPFYAENAIDGNLNTMWHTDFRYNVIEQGQKPYLVIKLDQSAYLSALEFIQTKYKWNDPDYIKNVIVYVSMDGESWKQAGRVENLPTNTELRVINFTESVEALYVKLEMETYNMFASVAMINLFQDVTLNPHPTAGVAYSTESPTSQNVVARLVNLSDEDIVITNPPDGSQEYIFTEEGKQEFTFEFYRESDGKKGTAIAVVDWIDKTAPTARIQYSPIKKTNGTVIATLIPSETVTVTNNNTYYINENNQVVDRNGIVLEDFTVDNEGTILDQEGNVIENTGSFEYEFYDNGEFTFEFVDQAGNKGTATATVNFIDTTVPTATIQYSTVDKTSSPVSATLIPSEKVTILNNGGSATYTFTKNGKFTFQFQDEAGNLGEAEAVVDWIYKNTEENNQPEKPSNENGTSSTTTTNENNTTANNNVNSINSTTNSSTSHNTNSTIEENKTDVSENNSTFKKEKQMQEEKVEEIKKTEENLQKNHKWVSRTIGIILIMSLLVVMVKVLKKK